MRRDYQLIRKLLLHIEANSNGIDLVPFMKSQTYTDEQIEYHLALLAEAGIIDARDASSGSGLHIMPIRLTWEGHEFLDDARNDTVWNKTLHDIGDATESIAFTVLRELLAAAVRAQFMPH